MLVAIWINTDATSTAMKRSGARKLPVASATALPTSTGTVDAVSEKGRASRHHTRQRDGWLSSASGCEALLIEPVAPALARHFCGPAGEYTTQQRVLVLAWGHPLFFAEVSDVQ